MAQRIAEKSLSLMQRLVFEENGVKFKAGELKFFMDPFFILLEKIGYKFNVISSNYLKLYYEIVKKELGMLDVTSNSRILVIGGGALPVTTALIAQHTKAKIVAIDKDIKSIDPAKNFIKQLNLEKYITIKYADGLTFPVKDFDVIFILYGIKKPGEILKYISESIDKNTKVIFRTIIDDKKISGELINIKDYFNILNNVKSKSLGSVDSFLLQKK